MSLLSIVLPAYNEEQNIANTAKVLGNCWNSTGSIMSWYLSVMVRRTEPLNVLRKNRPGIREYGERSFPGISERKREFCRPGADYGDAVIVMDCDLQHPPEVIPQMWEKWQQGAEIVEGIKADRGKESLGYKLSAGLFTRS